MGDYRKFWLRAKCIWFASINILKCNLLKISQVTQEGQSFLHDVFSQTFCWEIFVSEVFKSQWSYEKKKMKTFWWSVSAFREKNKKLGILRKKKKEKEREKNFLHYNPACNGYKELFNLTGELPPDSIKLRCCNF